MSNLDKYLHNNVVTYCQTLEDNDLLELSLFLGGEYFENEPNKLQYDFLIDFLGKGDWDYFTSVVVHKTKKETYFTNKYAVTDNIHKLYLYVSFQYLLRASGKKTEPKVSTNIKRAETSKFKKTLAKELDGAIENSFDGDSIFYKADAFSNIADVLTKHKLIDLTKYDKDEE